MANFKYLILFFLVMSLNTLSAQEIEVDEGIEEIVVTGSYLKTSPTDGASPIDVIDREASFTSPSMILLPSIYPLNSNNEFF